MGSACNMQGICPKSASEVPVTIDYSPLGGRQAGRQASKAKTVFGRQWYDGGMADAI